MAPLSLISEDNNLLDNTIKYSVENIRTEKEDAIKMAYWFGAEDVIETIENW